MDDRERRIGLNEAVFRQVNERLLELNEAFATVTETMKIVCECGNGSCTKELTLTSGEYESLRADPHRFAVVPGHEIPDVESIVERHELYFVVSKNRGPAERIAEITDPR